MPNVGVKELKDQATEILRNVREEQAQYIVTYHGRPVAVLLPIDAAWMQAEQDRAVRRSTARPSPDLLAELAALRAEIDASWRSDKTAVELIAEGRR
jgi:prevent-host-death family protein